MKNFPITPIREWIATKIVDSGFRVSGGGIIIPKDDMKQRGIRPRWAKVLAVGPDVNDLDDITPGCFVLLEHLGWVKGMDIEVENDIITVHWTVPEKIVLVTNDYTETTLPKVGITDAA